MPIYTGMYVGRCLSFLALGAVLTGCLEKAEVTSDASTYSPGSNPVAVISNPPPAYTNQTTFNFTVTSSIADQYLFKYGPTGGIDCGDDTGYSQNAIADPLVTAGMPDGSYRICIRGMNTTFGTTSSSATYNFTIDTVPPNGIIYEGATQTDPTNNPVIEFMVVFDDIIQSGTFTNADVMNGGTANVSGWTVSTTDNQTFRIRTTNVTSEGMVMLDTFAAIVTDRAGNLAVFATVDNNVTYDVSFNPALSVEPSQGSVMNTTTVTVQGDCESGSTIDMTGDFDESPLSNIVCSASRYSQSITLSAPDGNKSFTVNITDPAGNTDTLTRSLVLSTANAAPLILAANCPRYAFVNQTYICNFDADHIFDTGDAPTWFFQSNTCPFTINSTTGQVSGVPALGSNSFDCAFEVSVDDGVNGPSDPWMVKVEILGDTGITHLDVGFEHVCAVQDQSVKCWGSQRDGALGNGVSAPTAHPSPFTVPLTGDFRQVALGESHSCALRNDGAVWCWGRNNEGQIGDGTTTGRVNPTQVPSFSGVKRIAAGWGNTCAIRGTNNQLYCWGSDDFGQVGDGGAFSDRNVPTAVVDINGSPLVGVLDVDIGETHICALMSNRSVYCWGDGTFGQLGTEMTAASSRATSNLGFGLSAIPAVRLAVGDVFGCAQNILNGGLFCWGNNDFGQVGRGIISGNFANIGDQIGEMSSLVPVALGGVAKSLSSGRGHSCAVTDNNLLFCWGRNEFGQLGQENTNVIGDNESVSSAGAVNLGSRIPVSVAAGGFTTCARVEDGGQIEVVCWGDNAMGQLGYSTGGTPVGDDPGEMGFNLQPVTVNWPNGYILFASSLVYSGNLGGISGAEGLCVSHATSAGMPNASSFTALLSINGNPASSRLSSGVGPIVDVNGNMIAGSFGDIFSGGILGFIQFDENKNVVGAQEAWTGTLSDGSTAPDTCNDWASSGSGDFGRVGWTNSITGAIDSAVDDACSTAKRIYCISTVPN